MAINYNVSSSYINGSTTSDVIKEYKVFDTNFKEALKAGNNLAHARFASRNTIKRQSGLNFVIFRNVGFDADPRTRILNQEGTKTTTGGQKAGIVAIQGTMQYFGDYAAINDVIDQTMIIPVMAQIRVNLAVQTFELTDNVTALGMFNGASKVYVKTTGTKTTAPVYGADGSAAETAGKLTHDVLRAVTLRMINHTEKSIDGVTHKATIRGVLGSKYAVLISPNTMESLIDDEKFASLFIQGIQNDTIKTNTINTVYRHNLSEIDNSLRWQAEATAGASTIDVSGVGNREVTFVIGKDAYAVTTLNGEGFQYIYQPFGSDGDPLARAATIGWKGWMGVQVINSAAIYAIIASPGDNIISTVDSPGHGEVAVPGTGTGSWPTPPGAQTINDTNPKPATRSLATPDTNPDLDTPIDFITETNEKFEKVNKTIQGIEKSQAGIEKSQADILKAINGLKASAAAPEASAETPKNGKQNNN